MEPQFQTSFIPKKPMMSGAQVPADSENHANVFSVFSTIVFVIALVACGALFAYQQVLNGQIKSDITNIDTARSAFQLDTIKELVNVSDRIGATQKLLNAHVATYQIFGVLQSLTVKKVRFTKFSFENTNGVLTVGMSVEAQSYNALAEQLQIFSQSKFFLNSSLSDFDVSDNGNILTEFKATIDQNSLLYKNTLQTSNPNQ